MPLLPPGQAAQLTEAALFVYVPRAHSVHESCAGVEVYFPAMQSVHEEAPSWLEALPGAQSVQLGAISKEYVPLPQETQETAPGESL